MTDAQRGPMRYSSAIALFTSLTVSVLSCGDEKNSTDEGISVAIPDGEYSISEPRCPDSVHPNWPADANGLRDRVLAGDFAAESRIITIAARSVARTYVQTAANGESCSLTINRTLLSNEVEKEKGRIVASAWQESLARTVAWSSDTCALSIEHNDAAISVSMGSNTITSISESGGETAFEIVPITEETMFRVATAASSLPTLQQRGICAPHFQYFIVFTKK
jgi:hypothetical protein